MNKNSSQIYQFFFICALACFFNAALGKSTFVITGNLQEAQKNIASLKLDAGKVWVEAEKKANPNNAAA